jgi:hypothetical protein
MSKRDVIDEQMARRFAWRTVEPEDATAEEDPKPPDPPGPPGPPGPPSQPPDDEQVSEAELARWERARRVAAGLAKEIERAWETTARAQQAAATASLLQRAKRIGAELVTMKAYPIESVRLWRLAARHVRRLPARVREKDIFALVYLSPPLSEPEMADLLVEAAESGDITLAAIVNGYLERRATGRRHREIGVRLARVVAEGKTWKARESAARWLSAADLDAATPALRRALRQPRLELRSRALTLLLERTPPALTEDDVLWLLEDAVKHTPLAASGTLAEQAVKRYADALLAAVTRVPPPQGYRPLALLVDRGDPSRWGDVGLDLVWALRALAAAYPARALGRIDRALLTNRRLYYLDGIKAAALLPAELARPRLLEAAARANHHLAERAKAIWFERFGEECPVEPLAGVPVELLAGAPTERFFACLTVLRGSSKEAHIRMMEALLAEAPPPDAPKESLSAKEREALALLLFAARTAPYIEDHLPWAAAAWTELLLARFGAPAFAGLAAMAERDALAGLDHEWLSALADLWNKGALPADSRDRLRDIACAGLRSPAWEGSTAPLVTLYYVGAPADAAELLFSVLTTPEDVADPIGSYRWSVHWAGEALVKMGDAPGLDARLAAAAIEAREARAWAIFERVATIGCQRGAEAVIEVTRRAVLDFDGETEAFDAVYRAGYALREAGHVDEAWLVDVLHRPASPSFAIAARLVSKTPSLAELAALNRALEVPGRHAEAAAAAAETLFAVGALGAEDRRLDAILELAPARARASLMGRLLMFEVPLSPFRRHILELLASPEREVAKPVLQALLWHKPAGMTELIEDALPLAASPEVRLEMEEALGEPREEETYWRNAGDEVAEGFEDDAEDEPT